MHVDIGRHLIQIAVHHQLDLADRLRPTRDRMRRHEGDLVRHVLHARRGDHRVEVGGGRRARCKLARRPLEAVARVEDALGLRCVRVCVKTDTKEMKMGRNVRYENCDGCKRVSGENSMKTLKVNVSLSQCKEE